MSTLRLLGNTVEEGGREGVSTWMSEVGKASTKSASWIIVLNFSSTDSWVGKGREGVFLGDSVGDGFLRGRAVQRGWDEG